MCIYIYIFTNMCIYAYIQSYYGHVEWERNWVVELRVSVHRMGQRLRETWGFSCSGAQLGTDGTDGTLHGFAAERQYRNPQSNHSIFWKMLVVTNVYPTLSTRFKEWNRHEPTTRDWVQLSGGRTRKDWCFGPVTRGIAGLIRTAIAKQVKGAVNSDPKPNIENQLQLFKLSIYLGLCFKASNKSWRFETQ